VHKNLSVITVNLDRDLYTRNRFHLNFKGKEQIVLVKILSICSFLSVLMNCVMKSVGANFHNILPDHIQL
jgi:hypothetical protein